MATKREFLVTLGLAKAGRGRFGKEALAALAEAEANGVVFDEPVKPEPKPKKAAAPKPPKQEKQTLTLVKPARVKPAVSERVSDPIKTLPKVREQTTMYAITPIGRTHARIGYDTCFRQSCGQPVSLCPCTAGPKPPAGAIPVGSYPKV